MVRVLTSLARWLPGASLRRSTISLAVALACTHALAEPPKSWSAVSPPSAEPKKAPALGATATGRPAAAAAIPPALTHYMGRQIAITMHYSGADWLTRESRQREEDCRAMLAALDVKPGQAVCDMGCGNGFYSLQLATLVGTCGKVVAVDIQQEMLHMLQQRAKQTGHANLDTVLGTPVDPGLAPCSMDLVLLVDVYHEFSHPEQMLAAIRRSLRPRGRMVLVEFRLEDPKVPIKLEHKMSKAQVLKELLPAGFRLVAQYDRLPWQHMMFFERAEQAQQAAGSRTP